MKKQLAVVVGSLGLSGMLFAQDVPWSREYGWAEFGGAMIPDLDATAGLTGGTGSVSSDVKLKFSPGFSVNGGLGERFNEWLGAEIQGGFLYHNIDEIAGPGVSSSPDASLLQVPVFFNLVFEIPLRTPLTPYAGVGVGALINWLDIDDEFSTGGLEPVEVEDSSTEINFAYHAFAGARLRMGNQGIVELTYRFMGGSSPNWSLKEAETGDSIGNLKADDVFVHALTLGFVVEF
jgi:opacity protein-like surface antigen